MAALTAFIILAVLFSLAIVLGAGGVLFVIALVALVAAGLWLGMTYMGGRTPARAVRRTKREELLGPGGPDDPDRSVT